VPGTAAAAPCGNGTIQGQEECDDGNNDDGDCCSSTCTFEVSGSSCDDVDACTGADTCDGAGTCNSGPPLVCDDGLFCNGTESCDSLSGCQAGTPPNLDDGVACTDDGCDEVANVVVNTPNDANCDNGAWCDGAETCDAVLDCQVGTDPCPGGVICNETTDACEPCLVDATCDDGLFCNGAEVCNSGVCEPGPPVILDDTVACTIDSCDEVSDVVVNTPDDAACDDGLFCNGAEICDAALDCQPGTPPSPDDGIPCTDDSCDEGGDVVVNAPNHGFCSNGLFCDGSEVCDPILNCQAGAPACTGSQTCDEGADVCVGPQIQHVIILSVDGVNSDLLKSGVDADDGVSDEVEQKGVANSGDYHNWKRLQEEGLYTWNARADYNYTVTTPNHTSMITGHPVGDAPGTSECDVEGGPSTETDDHCYTNNGEPSSSWTLHAQGNTAIPYFASAWDVAHDNGLSTSHFASKTKFVIFEQSYDAVNGAPDVTGSDDGADKIDRYFEANLNRYFDSGLDDAAEMHAYYMWEMFGVDIFSQYPGSGFPADGPATGQSPTQRYNLSFIHYVDPDKAGHADSWTSSSGRYMETLRQSDDYIGDVMNAIQADPVLNGKTALIVVTDHGGGAPATHHDQADNILNYKIPMFIWGSGIAAGTEFYSINGSLRTDPGTGRPNFDLANMAGQPLRNSGAGNLALQMLGLPAIPGSTVNELQDIVLDTGVCGDTVIDVGEDCDDGNTSDGDCCSSTCSYETSGSSCDDGDACTEPDSCDGAGTCDSGAPVVCDNGQFCDGTESCDSILGCVAGVPVSCDDSVSCTNDSCDEGTDTCLYVPDDLLCDDGAFCNGIETCHAILDCQTTGPIDCNDSIPCTLDSCDDLTGCVNDPDDLLCSDGQLCDGTEVCHLLLGCQDGAPLDCDDGNACTADACDDVTGCSNTPIACGAPVPIPAASGFGRALLAILLLGAGVLLAANSRESVGGARNKLS
jgi:cysteine-rich repeat protein